MKAKCLSLDVGDQYIDNFAKAGTDWDLIADPGSRLHFDKYAAFAHFSASRKQQTVTVLGLLRTVIFLAST